MSTASMRIPTEMVSFGLTAGAEVEAGDSKGLESSLKIRSRATPGCWATTDLVGLTCRLTSEDVSAEITRVTSRGSSVNTRLYPDTSWLLGGVNEPSCIVCSEMGRKKEPRRLLSILDKLSASRSRALGSACAARLSERMISWSLPSKASSSLRSETGSRRGRIKLAVKLEDTT